MTRPSQRSGARTWIPDSGDTSIRHRYGMPWWAARLPPRWHACRPQTVQLYRDGGLLTGSCHCACGAVTDHTGRWTGRNTRRHGPDPAGLRRDPRTPQPVRARVAADATPHPGARHHPRIQPAEA
ncbi:MAG: hypothetical protein GEU83_17875 [Pseudonocardiaceae bacterium]|nr:hypothetical protein [Pseudonocardiaceae bacterium]